MRYPSGSAPVPISASRTFGCFSSGIQEVWCTAYPVKACKLRQGFRFSATQLCGQVSKIEIAQTAPAGHADDRRSLQWCIGRIPPAARTDKGSAPLSHQSVVEIPGAHVSKDLGANRSRRVPLPAPQLAPYHQD